MPKFYSVLYTKKAPGKVMCDHEHAARTRVLYSGIIPNVIYVDPVCAQKRKNKSFADGLLAVDNASYTVYDEVCRAYSCQR